MIILFVSDRIESLFFFYQITTCLLAPKMDQVT